MGSYRHLTRDDRDQIAGIRFAGLTLSEIGSAVGKSKSTISRELRRNALDSGGYSAAIADGAYMERRQRSATLEQDAKLSLFVRQRLSEGLLSPILRIVCRARGSPQQISGWLRSGAEVGLRAVAMETIYSFIYRAGQKSEELWKYLVRRRKKRRAMRSQPSRDTIKDRVSIHDRPEEGIDRSTLGHWEGDLILCQRTCPVLVLHERKTRVTFAARLTGKAATETASVIMSIFKRLDTGMRQSITFDNGTGFARHAWLRETLEMATYFCDAYASWQKGGIENANGRLRRWLPRQTNLDDISDEEMVDIVMTYNLTPRKCLGYKTPLQALFSELGRDVRLHFA